MTDSLSVTVASQKAMQSSFGASHTELAPAEGADMFDTIRASTRDTLQDAATTIGGQGQRHSDAKATSTAAPCSSDTAYWRRNSMPSTLERNSKLLGRSSHSLSRISKKLGGSRAGTAATAEIAKQGQEQQQTSRHTAAPVLKAVPSTKVSSI